MAKGIDIVVSAIDKASKTFAAVTSKLGLMDKKTQEASRNMGIAFAAVGAAAGALGLSMIKSAAGFEQSQVAFTTMLGSGEKAKKFLEDLTDFAKRTPFELRGLEETSKKLLAYGIEQEKVLPNLESLGNIAAGVGMDKLPQLTLAFGQVKAATKLTGMELRQFSEAGVPMLDALAKVMGKTVVEIQEMVSAGEVGFGAVEVALQSLSGEGGRFANLMAKQSETLAGKWSNLADAWDIFLREEGKALLEWAKQFVDMLIDLVNEGLPKMIAGIKDATKWLGEHKIVLVAVGGYLVGTMIPAVVSLGTTIATTLAATGPVGISIAALAASIYGIQYAINAVRESTNKLYDDTPKEVPLTKTAQEFTVSMREGDKMVQKFSGTIEEWEEKTKKALKGVRIATQETTKESWELFEESMEGSYEEVKNFTLQGAEKLANFRLNMVALSANAAELSKETFDELTMAVIEDVTQMQNAMENMWGGFVSSAQGTQEVITDIWVSFRQGVGDSVAAAILEGKSLIESFKSLLKSMLANVISALIQAGIERIALALVYGTANLKEITGRMASLSAATYAAAYAGSVGVPLIGPAIAPGIASAAVAAMLGGASASAGLGASTGAAIGALHGGLDNIPSESTYLLQAGERVLSPRQNKDLTGYLQNGGGGGVVVNELNIMPNSSIDEAMFDKPISWWSDLMREKILPAMNSLGRSGYKTSMAYDSMAVD